MFCHDLKVTQARASSKMAFKYRSRNSASPTCNKANLYKPFVIYDPLGTKVTKPVYGIGVNTDHSLNATTDRFNDMGDREDWRGILELVGRTRKTDPDWFTLDFEEGQANVQLCRLQVGENELGKFVSETADASAYEQLRDGASKLITFADDPGYRDSCLKR
jgi:hypothetical protein